MKKDKYLYNQYKDVITDLVSFASRPGMYIGKEDMDLVLAFLSGIDFSTRFQLRFGNDLMEYVFSKYDKNEKLQELKKNLNCYSLKEQMNVLSLETNQTPVQVFKLEATNLLAYISDEIFDGLYRQNMTNQLKKYLINNIDSVDEIYTTSFIYSPEDYILRYLNEWTGKTIPNKQLEILNEIKDENSRRLNEWSKHKNGQIDDKTRLRELSNKLLNEINRDG